MSKTIDPAEAAAARAGASALNSGPALNPAELPDVTCSCGSPVWIELITIKKIDQFISPTGKTELTKLPFVVCSNCQKQLAEVLVESDEKKEAPPSSKIIL